MTPPEHTKNAAPIASPADVPSPRPLVSEPSTSVSADTNSSPLGIESIAKTMFNVAWMAIVLGLVMQLLGLGVQAAFSKTPSAKPVVADSVQKVSWSLFVCSGLAIGTAAARARGAAMGLAGLLSAPLAFTAAKALQKSTQQALALPVSATPVSPLVLACIKAIEYAVLGVALAYLGKKSLSKPKHYAMTGLIIGLTFGGTTLGLIAQSMIRAGTINYLALTSAAVNEIIFPIGCSMVIFAAQTLGSRASQAAKQAA